MGVRKLLAGGVVLALATTGLAFVATSSAGAAKPVVTAVGSVSCLGSGRVKAITQGVSPNNQVLLAAKIKAGCSGTTGNPNVTVTSAKISLSLHHTGDCGATFPSQISVGIKWKAQGGKVTSTGFTANADGNSYGWSFPSASGPSGSSGGSYASSNPPNGNIAGMINALRLGCLSPKQPTKHKGTLQFGFTL